MSKNSKVHVRAGDTVIITAGKEKGKKGKVVRVFPAERRLIVEGANVVKKHTRPTQKVMQGGILEQAAAIHASNVVLVCRGCGEPTRVGHKVLEDGSRVRTCRRCGEVIDG